MQVINIIHGQLLLAQKKRGDCIYGQQQVREERRGEERNPWLAHCTRYLGNNS